MAQGEALLGVRRPRDAIKVLRQALATDPENIEVRQLLGFALMNDKQYKRALEELNGAIALAPEDSIGHDYRAWALHHLGRDQEAVRSAMESVRLEPGVPRSLRTLSFMQLRAKQVEESAATADRVLAIDPSAETFDSVGLVRIAQGKPKEAIEWFQRAVALEPNNAQYQNNLGVALLKANKIGKGLDMLGEAVRTDPRSETARSNLFIESQLYLGWFGLLFVFGIRVAFDAIVVHRFSVQGVALAFCLTTAVIVVLRYYKLMRMDRQARKFHLAEVRRARRAILPLVTALLGVLWVGVAAGYFFGVLDSPSAGSLGAAAFAVAVLFGVVLPWPVEYLPWSRRS
jgi:tetratricopeptide (TPR) repeat protein